jgi:hypothetical protein
MERGELSSRSATEASPPGEIGASDLGVGHLFEGQEGVATLPERGARLFRRESKFASKVSEHDPETERGVDRPPVRPRILAEDKSDADDLGLKCIHRLLSPVDQLVHARVPRLLARDCLITEIGGLYACERKPLHGLKHFSAEFGRHSCWTEERRGCNSRQRAADSGEDRPCGSHLGMVARIGACRASRIGAASPARARSGRKRRGARARGHPPRRLARRMGCSVKVIDDTYGHLARDSEAAIRARLEARSGRSGVKMASDTE